LQGQAADDLTEEDVHLTSQYHIRVLRAVRSSPYFGRIDFGHRPTRRVENLYIGRTAVWGENADDLAGD